MPDSLRLKLPMARQPSATGVKPEAMWQSLLTRRGDGRGRARPEREPGPTQSSLTDFYLKKRLKRNQTTQFGYIEEVGMVRICMLSLALLYPAGWPIAAQSPGTLGRNARTESVTASLVADVTAVAPGHPFTIGVKFDIPAGYYTYYKTSGSTGLPTRVSLVGPRDFAVGSLQFPPPQIKYEEVAGRSVTTFAYRRSTILLASVTPPTSLKPGGVAEFSAQVTYQFCSDAGMCFPPKPQTLKLALPIVASAEEVRPSSVALSISAARSSLPVPGSRSKFAKVRAALNRNTIRPGEEATLSVVVEVEPGHKLQMHRPPVKGLVSTELVLDQVAGIRATSEPKYPAPERPKELDGGFETAGEYRGRFVITVPVAAASSLADRSVALTGLLQYQACTDDGTCYPPQFASFEVNVPVAAH